MSHQETLAKQVVWCTKNVAYNLDFIADDKLNWKPAESANSALEVIQHMLVAFAGLQAGVTGVPGPDSAGIAVPASRAEAKEKLIAAGAAYAAVARAVPDADLTRVVDLGPMKVPVAIGLQIAIIDALHHHGQIAYIQTLLGDTESHFDMEAFSQM